MKSLTLEQIIKLHDDIINKTSGSYGIRDNKMLKALVYCPFQTVFNKECYKTDLEKICKLSFELVKQHPFIDGNKRIGAHILLVLSKVNNLTFQYSQKELSDLFLKLASSEYNYNNLLNWIRGRVMNVK